MKAKKITSMLVVAVMAASMVTACGTTAKKTEKTVETVADMTEKVVKDTLHLSVTADKGWDKDSTPAIAHIVSGNKKVDFYHAVSPDKDGKKGSSEVELEAGKYTVEFVSPLNKDGSAYAMEKAQEITIDEAAKDEPVIECPMTQIPADKVTDEMVKDIVAKTKDAVDKGDESLKGDAGKTVLDNLEKNVAANPNVTDETKKETADAKETAKVEEKPAETAKKEEASSNNSASSNNNTVSNSNNNAQASQPAHQHSWVAHTATRQVWVPNIVTVDDYQQQQVCVGYQTVCNCGVINPSHEHTAEHLRKGEWDNTWAEAIYEWQNVKVGSHTEDHGSYTTENYTDYYYCSCGATK